jgi:two-component sensor histidine kinase
MHCILEGLVQHHVRSLLGLTTEKSKSSTASASTPAFHYDFQKIDSETAAALSMSTKEIAQVSSIHALLVAQVPSDEDTTRIATYMEKLTDSLLHTNMRPLQFVCQSLHCVPIKYQIVEG